MTNQMKSTAIAIAMIMLPLFSASTSHAGGTILLEPSFRAMFAYVEAVKSGGDVCSAEKTLIETFQNLANDLDAGGGMFRNQYSKFADSLREFIYDIDKPRLYVVKQENCQRRYLVYEDVAECLYQCLERK